MTPRVIKENNWIMVFGDRFIYCSPGNEDSVLRIMCIRGIPGKSDNESFTFGYSSTCLVERNTLVSITIQHGDKVEIFVVCTDTH